MLNGRISFADIAAEKSGGDVSLLTPTDIAIEVLLIPYLVSFSLLLHSLNLLSSLT